MKESVIETFRKIESLMAECLLHLEILTVSNFESEFEQAKEKLSEAKKLRKSLENQTKGTNIKSELKKLDILAKQISQKYDSIIKEWSENVSSTLTELLKIQNQKKIVNYTRS